MNSRANDRVLVYNNEQVVPSWQWQADLPLPADVAAGDRAGSGVAITGDTAFVGAPLDDQFGTDAGAVLVYTRDDNGTAGDLRDDIWTLASTLSASDAAAGDQFGTSLSVDGDLLVVAHGRKTKRPVKWRQPR